MNLSRKLERICRIPLVNSISSAFFLFILIFPAQTHSYDFRLESSKFTGKGLVGDFGDFDNTGSLSFATYSYNTVSDKTTIYIYSDITKSGESDPYYKFQVDGECDGITAADFDSNDFLDLLLVMKKKPSSGDTNTLYYFLVYYQHIGGEFGTKSTWDSRQTLDGPFSNPDNKIFDIDSIKSKVLQPKQYQYSTIHPLVADFDGDGYFDILAQTPDLKLFFWMNLGQFFLPFPHNKVQTFTVSSEVNGFIPNPHSCAFIDMNGDCRPDLVLMFEDPHLRNVYIDIWLSDAETGTVVYKHSNNFLLPKNHGMITFGDFDNDGTNDVLVPFCDSVDSEGYCKSTCKIAISYNKQIPFCPQMFQTSDQLCRHPANLCVHSRMDFTPFTGHVIELPNEYTYIYPLNTSQLNLTRSKFNYLKVPRTASDGPESRKDLEDREREDLERDKLIYTKLPTQLQRVTAGDFNNNGFLDLIIPMKVVDSRSKYSSKDEKSGKVSESVKYLSLIAKNSSKDKGEASYDEFIPVIIDNPDATLTHVTTADIVDRRMLNMIVFLKSGEKLSCLYYSLYRETIDLFMKLMTKYMVIDESKYPDNYFISGSNNNVVYTLRLVYTGVGLTYKLTVIDIHGIKFAKTATLRPQTAYSPLYTPFTFIGLGKTNNYVEEFYLGASSSDKNCFHMWISIIPSCTVITVPVPLESPSQWVLKLSIIPGKKLFTILITTSVSLIIFGIIVLIFDFKEKREDFIQAKGFRQKFIIN
ncbi:T-cell immunomodulatory-like protein [Theileria parva strain Muguga]|uniref:T-cell immunomodulatory-like protein n=1 Tax=Theileria parva strain Muguga TaxID=333668 RepID=UPI001C61D465|nr:T-cell immunomodulatory-like protein [Theileria parva strain Muguga]EAN31391.2 T-cell immunomodulatory-like protein [Theileria parva strain Muguga]